MLILVVDLHVGNTGELLHRLRKWLHDVIACAARPAVPGEVNVERAILKLNAPIADEAVPDRHQTLALFLGVRPFEIFIQSGCNGVGRAGDLANNRIIERRDTLVDLLGIGEIDLDRQRDRRPCCGGRR